MGTQTKQSMSVEQRRRRHFSDSFKQSKVHEIEAGLTRICDLCKTYQCTTNTVYRWIQKFGSMKKKPERMIIENQSDTQQLLALKKQVAELERVIGQKQILLDFKDKMIELAEEHYKLDIKKKFSTSPSNTSGKRGKETGLH